MANNNSRQTTGSGAPTDHPGLPRRAEDVSEQLLVLANTECRNAKLIHMGLFQGERLKGLIECAIRQMLVLTSAPAIKQL